MLFNNEKPAFIIMNYFQQIRNCYSCHKKKKKKKKKNRCELIILNKGCLDGTFDGTLKLNI